MLQAADNGPLSCSVDFPAVNSPPGSPNLPSSPSHAEMPRHRDARPFLLLFLLVVLGIAACSKTPVLAAATDVDYWTCTMHPSVHSEAPGKCPICGMDLVPVMKKSSSAATPTSSGGTASGHEFVVPVERQQQIGVTYATVTRAPLHHTIRAVGNVDTDL